MNKIQRAVDVNALGEHTLVTLAFNDAKGIVDLLTDSSPNIDAPYKRLPDEYEFYVLRVGSSLASLLHVCLQLDQALFYMSNCRITQAMRKARITRPEHLLYNIENYIIHTQMLYDRILQLVNAVVHLCNSRENCTDKVISANVKVKQTNLPRLLKSMKKRLGSYKAMRIKIVHHESYHDDELQGLSYISNTLLSSPELARTNPELSNEVHEFIDYRARGFARGKKNEYARFNTKVFKELLTFFDELRLVYEQQKRILDIDRQH